MRFPFFSEIISRHGVQPDLYKEHAISNIPPPNNKLELKSFIGYYELPRKILISYCRGV